MRYDFLCPDHGAFEVMCRVAQMNDPRPCPECGSECARDPALTMPYVVFKGDGWVDKNLRIKKQMASKNRTMDQRMRDHVKPAPGMVPNYKGQDTGTWAEAQNLAAADKKDSNSFAPMVKAEKKVLNG